MREKRICALKRDGFFRGWAKRKHGEILFYLWPDMQVPPGWIRKRTVILGKNAQILGVRIPTITFFVYPSREPSKDLGFIPAFSFVSQREIHGHLEQSPGHELTHILLRQLNDWKALPANGFFSEGVCTYLDGTNTDRRRHTATLHYDLKSQISWEQWYSYLPSVYYPLAGSFIQYLVQKYGWGNVRKFLKSLTGLRTIQKVFRGTFGIDLDAVEAEWREWLATYKAN